MSTFFDLGWSTKGYIKGDTIYDSNWAIMGHIKD